MTVTEKMYSLLATALTGTVPASRIKAPDAGNQGLPRPYVVHYWSDVSSTRTHDNSAANLATWEYVVVIAADGFEDGETLFFSLKDALVGNSEGFTVSWVGGHYGGLDNDTKAHGFILRFAVAE